MMPPPRTLSISLIPEELLLPPSVFMLLSLRGLLPLPGFSFCAARVELPFAGLTSMKLFQLPQSGHFPSHLGSVCPHDVHSKKVFSLAMKRFCLIGRFVSSENLFFLQQHVSTAVYGGGCHAWKCISMIPGLLDLFIKRSDAVTND
jgi:hypothetical protein